MAAVDRKRLSIQDFSPEMQDSLRALDLDGSGSVDSRELARAAEAYRSVQARAKRLNRMLAFGAVVLLLTLAAFSGLVFAVVEMTKESTVGENGALLVKGTNATVKTSQVLNKSNLCSQLGDELFRDMRYLEVTSPTGAAVSLNILGWARMPEAHSLHGTVVVLVTQVGTVTIDGSELRFENEVAPFFAKAGFSVSSSNRRLQGLYKIAAFLNSIEGIEDGCGHVSYNLPVVPNKFHADATSYQACVWADSDRCEGKAMGDSLVHHEGAAFASYPTRILGSGSEGIQMSVNTYPHIDASQKHVVVESEQGIGSYQQHATTFEVSHCSVDSGNTQAKKSGDFFSQVDSFTYEGMAIIPFLGTEGRKFNLVQGEAEYTLYDQMDASTGEYVLKALQAGPHFQVFNNIAAHTGDIDVSMPATCPEADLPFHRPGVTKVDGPFPITQRMTEAEYAAVREITDSDNEITPAVMNTVIVEMGLDYETFTALSEEWPNSTYVYTSPAGETARSVEEFEDIFEKYTTEVEAASMESMMGINSEVANEESSTSARRDLQGWSMNAGNTFTKLGLSSYLGLTGVVPSNCGSSYGFAIFAVCFKSKVTYNWSNAKIKAKNLKNYGVGFMSTSCIDLKLGGGGSWSGKLLLVVATPLCYILIKYSLPWAMPTGMAGFELKIEAQVWLDWNSSAVAGGGSIRAKLAHPTIDAIVPKWAEKWVNSCMPYALWTMAGGTSKRIFEGSGTPYTFFGDTSLTLGVGLPGPGIDAHISIKIFLKIHKQSSSTNHVKFVQKHYRKDNYWRWACCGVNYYVSDIVSFGLVLTIKLKIGWFAWWEAVKETFGGGWVFNSKGAIGYKHTAGTSCSKGCSRKRRRRTYYRKHYACKGINDEKVKICKSFYASGAKNSKKPSWW